MNNILVTGGNGFIGINLVKHLLENTSAKIFSLDNYYSSGFNNTNLFLNNPRVLFLHRDIRLPLSNVLLNQEIDTIFHLACPASPPIYQFSPIYTHETNVYGMVNVLKLAVEKYAKVIFTSTSEIYGDPQVDIQNETYLGNVKTVGPRACYDEGKRISETICYDYHKTYGLDIKIARLFNSYGPYMDRNDGRVVSNFITQALSNTPLTVYGDGSQTRSLCHVSDTVKALFKLAQTDETTSASPINIGNPNELSVLEIANKIIELTESSSKIEYKELPLDDPRKRHPDISLAKRKLDWEPEIDLDTGLLETIGYFRG